MRLRMKMRPSDKIKHLSKIWISSQKKKRCLSLKTRAPVWSLHVILLMLATEGNTQEHQQLMAQWFMLEIWHQRRLKGKLRNCIRKLKVFGPAFIAERLLLAQNATSGFMLRHTWMDCATLAIFATKISGLKMRLTFTNQDIINNFRTKKAFTLHIQRNHSKQSC